MDQLIPVAGPSQDAFNTLSDQIANLIKYADVSSVSFACTNADSGHYYCEVDRATLGLSGKILLLAQLTGTFASDEVLSITSASHKVCMIADSSKSVTRNIRVFYMSE